MYKIGDVMKLKTVLCLNILVVSMGYGESLDDLVKGAILKNPQVMESYYNYQVSEEELKVVEARKYPTLDLTHEEGRERTRTPANEGNRKFFNERQTSLVGRYTVFDGFERENTILEKQETRDLAKTQLDEKTNNIAFLVTQVYLDVLRKKALLERATKNYELHQETFTIVSARVAGGAGYDSDVNQTKARVDLAETNKVIAEKNYQLSQINYERFMLNPPNINAFEAPKLDLNALEHMKSLDNNMDEILEIANQKSFKVKIEESKNKIAKHVFQQQDKYYLPTVELVASISKNKNVYGIEGLDKGSKIALVMNYNLYNGGADEALKVAALKRHAMSLESTTESKLVTKENLQITSMQFKMLTQQLQLVASQLKTLKRTSELYEMEYDNNIRSIIDVLNVKQEYNYAESQEINMEYDRLLSYYQFKYTMGELLEEFKLFSLISELKNKSTNL